MPEIAKALSVDVSKTCASQPFMSSAGGVVTIDEPFTRTQGGRQEIATSLHIGLGGTVVVERIDGNPDVFQNVSNDRFIPGLFQRVLSSATLNDGNVYTTTASQIKWNGGA